MVMLLIPKTPKPQKNENIKIKKKTLENERNNESRINYNTPKESAHSKY
jgi:hypothetical protein